MRSECPSEYALDRYWLSRARRKNPWHEHINGCAECQDRLAECDRADAEFSSQVRPATRAAVLKNAVDAGKKRYPSTDGPHWLPRWTARPLIWALAGATACALLVGLWIGPFEPTPYVGTKGALQVQVFCQRQGRVFEVMPGEILHPEDRLRFVPSPPEPGYLMVISIDAHGQTSRYYPVSQDRAAAIPARPEPLPGSIVLDQVLGTERIIALFSPELFHHARVQRAVNEAWSGSVEALERLPLSDTIQQWTATYVKEEP